MFGSSFLFGYDSCGIMLPVVAVTFRRIAVVLAMILTSAFYISVRAQSQPMRPPPSQSTPDDKHDEPADFGSRESDARLKLILKAEKKAYEEHVGRAKEACDLAEEVNQRYEIAKVLNAADQKKLERLEKLTRRIRNEVGGSQTDADPKELPKTFDEGIKQLAGMAKDLYDQVQKTPRRVVSAGIIDHANKMIALIQYLRGPHD